MNKYNYAEDMNEHIHILNPHRWKVFQVLVLKGENSGTDGDLGDATRFTVTDEQFKSFLSRHESQKCLVAENNSIMKDSYLMLDEKMRFLYLDVTGAGKVTSASILEVGVEAASQRAVFDGNAFKERGGVYDWSRQVNQVEVDGCGSQCDVEIQNGLEW